MESCPVGEPSDDSTGIGSEFFELAFISGNQGRFEPGSFRAVAEVNAHGTRKSFQDIIFEERPQLELSWHAIAPFVNRNRNRSHRFGLLMRYAQNPDTPDFPSAQVLPGPSDIRFLLDGRERAVYHTGAGLPKPFVHPLRGPTGAELTRYGHPNPQSNHDHHRSIWFGHQFVRPKTTTPNAQNPPIPEDRNFWEEPGPNSDVHIRHTRTLALQDGSDFAAATVESQWWAGGRAILNQTTTYALVPIDGTRHSLDIQFELASVKGQVVELGKSNFGLLGVRVAKSISEQFGSGRLMNSDGAIGEPAIFGKPARWVDYSGATGPGHIEGVCYMDHPSNPRYPSSWHVRRDGWMIASFTLAEAWTIADGHPLSLRYRLLAHSGIAQPQRLERSWQEFSETAGYVLETPKGGIPTVKRKTTAT